MQLHFCSFCKSVSRTRLLLGLLALNVSLGLIANLTAVKLVGSNRITLRAPPLEEVVDPNVEPLPSVRGVWDRWRVFNTHYFVIPDVSPYAGDVASPFTPENWLSMSDDWQVCMSTQSSAEGLFWLTDHVGAWQGPISVAVFVPGTSYTVAAIMIHYLRACLPEISKRVVFHMTYPSTHPPVWTPSRNDLILQCDQPEKVNNVLHKMFVANQTIKNVYPQNLLRNVARQTCPSEYGLTVDMDMIPIPKLAKKLNQFLESSGTKECVRCAYVIPVYEIADQAMSPRNKIQLQQLVKNGKARRFHAAVWWRNQGNSQLHKWENLNKAASGIVQVMYNITSFQEDWEPVYIAKANSPVFDERFIGYGKTRSSQVYEMHLLGWKWAMLDNAFLTHRGLQTTNGYTEARRTQITINQRRYAIFKRELHARLGLSRKGDSSANPKEVPAADQQSADKAKISAPSSSTITGAETTERSPVEKKTTRSLKQQNEKIKMSPIRTRIRRPGVLGRIRLFRKNKL